MIWAGEGVVVEGDHRGRALGFPTANVTEFLDADLPDDGVYAGYAQRADGSRYLAAISVGHRPTFYGDDAPRLLEAYLLDFDDDLYGERLRVSILEHVRAQRPFSSRVELTAQIGADVERTRELVALPEVPST